MSIDFYKYHALGNDYIVIDPNMSNFNLNEIAIKLICDRNFGIGSDGILYGSIFTEEKIALRIFNPDGSEAEKSGNGIRIFSKYLVDAQYIKTNKFGLTTLGGEVAVEILNPEATLIKVDMGTVTFQSDLIPVTGLLRQMVDTELHLDSLSLMVTCLSIGNPHCVIPVAQVSQKLATTLGTQIENHPIFPKRINVQFLQVLNRQNIKIEIWERGAGYTLASGSSSCAAASAAYKLGLVDDKVKVHMPGGEIEVEIEGDRVFMTGSVSAVAKGEFAEDFLRSF
ncbi:diaminopimelate epimerase [Chroococcidiopsis sp. FACHB-1243]|uniref:diaminopimelate epimerase n=1 Tax=Chroococcidiopsis sp. [FACHB-1243] TaxID=2692781 RepID=UPI00177F634A|nr:diaminopimelate epimerase [Chroococcidiopsis sp. [FACHB-1243]]MBD2304614.1 diaminopimelate epimerase [Chroococcidiopsis sp. [FACHB-1243]]